MNFKTNLFTNECPSAIGTVRCTTCGGLISGELQYTGDNYCKGHDPEFTHKQFDFQVGPFPQTASNFNSPFELMYGAVKEYRLMDWNGDFMMNIL